MDVIENILIGTIKYLIEHNNYDTFYLNCITLRILLEKNVENIVKQILIN